MNKYLNKIKKKRNLRTMQTIKPLPNPDYNCKHWKQLKSELKYFFFLQILMCVQSMEHNMRKKTELCQIRNTHTKDEKRFVFILIEVTE